MQTIVGAGGPIANALAKEIEKNNEALRLVSRRKIETKGNTSWIGADLKDYNALLKAVEGSSIIYMCAGLQYNKKVWQQEWPIITTNLINVTKANGARLIFFDNVYMYGRVEGPMLESSPYKPDSVKGAVRAKVAEQLMNEIKAGNISASIARAADFYGAESMNSFFDSMVLSKLSQGAKPMWLGNSKTKHSFTYVPDAAKAVYLLGKHPETDNQIWHLPTAPSLTGIQFIKLAADIFNSKPGYMKVNKFMLNTIGLFNKMIAETSEMYYQYQYDYIFDSSKFEKTFNLKPTSYKDGIRELSTSLFKKN